MLIAACTWFEPALPADNAILDGPVADLNTAQNSQFLAGDIAFNDEIFHSKNGLGPVFVATSCGSCHAGDGKGHPFSTLTRFGQIDSTGNKFLHLGGPQLQNLAIPGYYPEIIPEGATFSKFTPPANTGLGFLELVSDADLLAMADPDDANGDGISGVPNWDYLANFIAASPGAISQDGRYIHRFGKKAAAYNLLHQTVNAYNQDIGITSIFSPLDVYSGLDIGPEISNQTVRNVVFYLQTLKAPIPRNQDPEKFKSGKFLFTEIGCQKCHVETLKTGISPVSALSKQIFHPYTDLLLHDMGPLLDDGYTEGNAKTAEWRTPPLWGLGLSANSQGGKYFLLHDGRARSIEQAIELHGGEGSGARSKFSLLNDEDREAIIFFLKSL